jgi:SAM-dependent methyltransferase
MVLSMLVSLLLSVHYSNDLTEVFESIYQTCEWGADKNSEGTSGSGSEFNNAKPYFYFLRDFLADNSIKSVVDIGCGDWQFSRLIDWSGIEYTGFDASKMVVDKNQKQFEKDNIKFIHGNFISMPLPKADLLICKDVLQHLSIDNVHQAIKKFKDYKYVIIVNDVDPVTYTAVNAKIKDGQYRLLDITQAPFKVKGVKVLSYKAKTSHEVKQVLLISN